MHDIPQGLYVRRPYKFFPICGKYIGEVVVSTHLAQAIELSMRNTYMDMSMSDDLVLSDTSAHDTVAIKQHKE